MVFHDITSHALPAVGNFWTAAKEFMPTEFGNC
jgi:hypothetical protein